MDARSFAKGWATDLSTDAFPLVLAVTKYIIGTVSIVVCRKPCNGPTCL